jgi:hypothetical protein
MFRPRIICAASLVLLLSGVAPPLALAASNPSPRAASVYSNNFAELWSSLRSLVSSLGHVFDLAGSLSSGLGHGIDPNGTPPSSLDSGHEIDPDG